MLTTIFVVPVEAAQGKASTYEVALLIDVSGSMNTADPQRISIESAKAFAYYYPNDAEYFNISVILYNTNVLTAIEGVDVSKEDGMNKYQECLTTIGNLKNNGKYNGFSCWAKDTDIGLAISQAKKILSSSNADKKAVILFTDGKIDLDNNFSVTTPAEQLSEKNSFEGAEYFSDIDTPMYTVGLNYNNGVDEAFMQKLADTTNGKYKACKKANELVDFYQEIYAYFVDGTVQNGTNIEVKPNVETYHEVNIFGQAISEANLVLFSSAVIKSYTVTNPNGTVIAELKENGEENVVSGCIVHRNDYTINIKLLHPTDGNWTVSFMSETSGTVQVGEIYLYNLEVADDGLKDVAVGDTVKFAPVLFNADTNNRITTQAIYETSKCYITVSKNGTNDIYTAKINSAKNGYELEKVFNTPGEYDITYRITNDQFEIEQTKKLKVLSPDLVVSPSKNSYELGDTVDFVCKLQHPLTSQEMSLPSYLEGFELTATVTLDGKQISADNVKYTSDNGIKFSLTPQSVGSYNVSVTIGKYSDTVTCSSPASFTVSGPKLVLEADKAVIQRGESFTFVAKLISSLGSKELNIKDYFTDSSINLVIKYNGEVIENPNVTYQSSSNGYSFTYVPDKTGEYSFSLTMKSDKLNVSSSAPIGLSVKDMTFGLWVDKTEVSINDGEIPILIEIFDINGNKIETLPEYLNNYSVVFEDSNGGKSDSVKLAEYFNGNNTFKFAPKKAGKYDITVTIEGDGQSYQTSIKLNIKPSKISVDEDDLSDITESTLSSSITKEIDLSDIFKDSDKDKLTYKVKTDCDDISYEIDDDVLILTIKSGAEGEVTIKASDGKGAECSISFDVAVKSTLPLLIAIIVIVVVIAAAIPIVIVILNKRRIPRIKYCVKISMNNDVAIYDINRANNNRRAKPVMTLSEILNITTLASYFDGDMSEENREIMLHNYCSKISVSGFAFKDSIRIITQNGKEKVFEKYIVTVPFANDEDNGYTDISVSFGKMSDFHDESYT